MPNETNSIDRIFSALADPTRRAVLARLCLGPTGFSVSELATPFAMALPSFTQHLAVLEECGLVRSEKIGRTRMVGLRPDALREAEKWMVSQRQHWETRLNQFDSYLKSLVDEKGTAP